MPEMRIAAARRRYPLCVPPFRLREMPPLRRGAVLRHSGLSSLSAEICKFPSSSAKRLRFLYQYRRVFWDAPARIPMPRPPQQRPAQSQPPIRIGPMRRAVKKTSIRRNRPISERKPMLRLQPKRRRKPMLRPASIRSLPPFPTPAAISKMRLRPIHRHRPIFRRRPILRRKPIHRRSTNPPRNR